MPRPKIMRTLLRGVLSAERECDTNLEFTGDCDVKGWDTNSEVRTVHCVVLRKHTASHSLRQHTLYTFL